MEKTCIRFMPETKILLKSKGIIIVLDLSSSKPRSEYSSLILYVVHKQTILRLRKTHSYLKLKLKALFKLN
jgi:hypothetical protein